MYVHDVCLTIKITVIKPQKKIRIKDIAEKANVSIGTVDRVLHNRGEVSQKTREKIMQIIEELEYQPNLLARSLASKKSYNIFVLMPEYKDDNDYWKDPYLGIENAREEIKDFGVNVDFFTYRFENKKSFISQSQCLLKAHPDAILLAPVFYHEALSFIQRCDRLNIPYAFLDSNIPDSNAIGFIGQNAYESGYLAGKLMNYKLTDNALALVVKIGQRHGNSSHYLNRAQGFESYFTKYAPDIKISTINISNNAQDEIFDALHQTFQQYKNIQGIFVVNSKVYQVAEYLKSTKNHKMLIGYDLVAENIKFLQQSWIDFLIAQQPREQGYKGIMTLFNYLMGKKNQPSLNYSPIDIITKENIDYYLNFECKK